MRDDEFGRHKGRKRCEKGRGNAARLSEASIVCVPLLLNHGKSKTGAPRYVPFRERRRDDTAAVKNAWWLEGKGKRKAEAEGITPLQLAKGLSTVVAMPKRG